MIFYLGILFLSYSNGCYNLFIWSLLYIFYNIYEYLFITKDIVLKSIDNDSFIRKGSKLSVGFDISSNCLYIISPRSRITIDTGIKLYDCPDNVYLRVASRSSLSQKGIDIGGDVIDPDYRGEIKIILINNTDSEYNVLKGDFIAQLIPEVISKNNIYFNKRRLLSNTVRNSNGFISKEKST